MNIRIIGAWLTLSLLMVSGCAFLPGAQRNTPDRYQLELPAAVPSAERRSNAPAIEVALPRSLAALDTSRMAYMQRELSLRYYARARWVDTPAGMLQQLLASALDTRAEFSAALESSSVAGADLRLETRVLHFEQDFSVFPSSMHIALRVQLVDLATNRVMATHVFEAREAAASEDAWGGARAANGAVHRLLPAVAEFCALQAVRYRR